MEVRPTASVSQEEEDSKTDGDDGRTAKDQSVTGVTRR